MSNTAPAAEHAILKTSYGEITLAFWSDVAPKTVENFKKVAREGFYLSLIHISEPTTPY